MIILLVIVVFLLGLLWVLQMKRGALGLNLLISRPGC